MATETIEKYIGGRAFFFVRVATAAAFANTTSSIWSGTTHTGAHLWAG